MNDMQPVDSWALCWSVDWQLVVCWVLWWPADWLSSTPVMWIHSLLEVLDIMIYDHIVHYIFGLEMISYLINTSIIYYLLDNWIWVHCNISNTRLCWKLASAHSRYCSRIKLSPECTYSVVVVCTLQCSTTTNGVLQIVFEKLPQLHLSSSSGARARQLKFSDSKKFSDFSSPGSSQGCLHLSGIATIALESSIVLSSMGVNRCLNWNPTKILKNLGSNIIIAIHYSLIIHHKIEKRPTTWPASPHTS